VFLHGKKWLDKKDKKKVTLWKDFGKEFEPTFQPHCKIGKKKCIPFVLFKKLSFFFNINVKV